MAIETYLAVLSLIVIGIVLATIAFAAFTYFIMKQAPKFQRKMMEETFDFIGTTETDFDEHVASTPGMTSPYHG